MNAAVRSSAAPEALEQILHALHRPGRARLSRGCLLGLLWLKDFTGKDIDAAGAHAAA